MLLLSVSSVREGMALAQPVLHPDRGDLLLLSDGFVLDRAMIEHLRKHRVTHVWISFPGLDELGRRVSPDVARSHMELFQVLNQSIERLEKRVEVKVNIQQYRKSVHQMLAQIVRHASHDPILHQLRLCGSRLAGHQANCAYLSLLVGAHLAGYLRTQRRALPSDVAENTAQLGLGALLHDVGKASMPNELRGVCCLDEEASWEEYRYHTIRGYEEVREHISPTAAHIVLHHHQRYGGGGFPKFKKDDGGDPQPLVGNKIHVFCRIVAAVNALDHLLCPEDPDDPVSTIEAISQLEDERFDGWFDPVVIEAIKRLIPPFMVGQVVQLSDGDHAVVIKNDAEAPLRPVVKRLSGPIEDPKTRVSPRPIDLRMARTLHITKVDGKDVSLHTAPTAPASERAA